MISVLYVDDEEFLLDICRIFLERNGTMTVDTASSVRDALVKLASNPYDIIISDYEMPETNGIEFLKIIRKKYGSLPFIIFTGRGREEIVIEAINSGVDFYLQKGGEPRSQFTELAHKIRQAVKSHTADQALKESEENFREIFESVNDAIHINEIDDQGMPGKVIEVNDVACQMLQYTRSELLEMKFADLSPDDNDTFRGKPHENLIQAGHAVFETVLVRRDKVRVPVEINSHITSLKGKKVVISVIRDITERKQAEDAIRESEKFSSEVISHAMEGVIVYDRDRRIILWNRFMETLTGIPSREVLGRNAVERFPDYAASGRARLLDQALAGVPSESPDFSFAIRSAPGRTGWARELFSPLYNTQGSIFGVIGIVRDITKSKQAEMDLTAAFEQLSRREEELRENYEKLEHSQQRLQKSEERFRLLFDHMGEGLALHEIIYDDNGAVTDYRILAVNAAYERQFGVSSSEVTGKTGREVYRSQDSPFLDRFSQVGISGKPESFETFFVPLKKYLRISVYSPRKNQFAAVFSDISEKMLAEIELKKKNTDLEAAYEEIRATEENLRQNFEELEASQRELKKSEARYRRIVLTAHEGIWVMDREFKTTFVNRQLEVFIGYTQDEMLGRTFQSYLPDGELEDQRQKLEERKAGRPGSYERRFVHRNGEIRWGLVSAAPLTAEDGSFAGSFAMITDITDRKKADAAIRQANRQIGVLTGLTRHDILNKMTVVRGYLDLLQLKNIDPETREILERLEPVTASITALIDFSTIYKDLGTRDPQWQGVPGIMERFNVPSGLDVSYHCPGLEIFADPMLEKVFFNLLDNTIRHGKTAVRARLSCHETADGLVIVWEDDGTGIAANEKEQIFLRGYGKHTGLGLFLAREILAVTGLTIRETGTEGDGARFEILVPKGAWRNAGDPADQPTGSTQGVEMNGP